MQKMRYPVRYLNYLKQSKTKFGVHSPFLYNLITAVFNDKTRYPAYKAIESLKKDLIADQREVEVTDYGAGSRVDRGNIRSISNITKHTSKPRKYGRLLYRLAKYLNPETTIELGTSMGLSSAYLAAGNPDGTVYTIEGCPNIANIAQSNINQLSAANIRIIQGRFEDKLQPLLEEIKPPGLIFIDGNHRKEPTLQYFEQCLSKAVNDTCLIFDDIHWSDDMDLAWNEIIHNRKVSFSVDIFFMGIVFLKKELTKQDFIIRF